MTRSRRSRGGHGGGGGGGGHGGGDARWLVTYADLLTLLMVLFLVLWVISTIDAHKFEKFKEGLGDFGNPAAVAAAQGETEVVNHSTQDNGEYNNTTTTTVATENTGPGDTVDPAVGPGQVLDAKQLGDVAGQLQAAIDNAGLNGVVNVEMDQRGLIISVSTDDVLFQPGSAALGPEATQIIATIAPELAGIGNDLIVEGYTDKRPLHRQNYDNWDLSVDRAVSVLKLLRDSPGIDADRLAATGYGDQHPIDPGDTEEAFAKNRRVEIVVVAGTLAEVAAASATTTTTVGA